MSNDIFSQVPPLFLSFLSTRCFPGEEHFVNSLYISVTSPIFPAAAALMPRIFLMFPIKTGKNGMCSTCVREFVPIPIERFPLLLLFLSSFGSQSQSPLTIVLWYVKKNPLLKGNQEIKL